MRPVVVIAEAGANFGGSLAAAQEMAVVARTAGADIVKFQTFVTEKIVHTTDPSYALLKSCELPKYDWIKLAKHCQEIGIEFLTTPGDLDSLKFAVEELGVKRIKVGSDDLTYAPLVRAAHKTGLPLILSTGMATPEEIRDAVIHINNFTLLHCISLYPCPPRAVNLRSIQFLRYTFSCPVGYSDHTANVSVVLSAVAAGAEMIEVHFKLNSSRTKPLDDLVAFTPGTLHQLVAGIRNIEEMLGEYGKNPTAGERGNAVLLRKGSDGLRGVA